MIFPFPPFLHLTKQFLDVKENRINHKWQGTNSITKYDAEATTFFPI